MIASGRRRAFPLAIAGALLLVIVFAVITSQEAVQWFEYLGLGKELRSMPIVSFGPPKATVFGPGLRLFRIALIAIYLPWLAYAVHRAAVDSLGVLSTGSRALGGVRFAEEICMSTISNAEFVVAALRLILPRLWLCAIGGGVAISLMLWSFGAEYPDYYFPRWQTNWDDILVAAGMFTMSGVLGSAVLCLTFISLGRGNQSGLFQLGVGAFFPTLQLAWLYLLFTNQGNSWLRTHHWFNMRDLRTADYMQASLLVISGYVLCYWLLFRWAAVNSAIRRALAFSVVTFGQFSYWFAQSAGNAGTYYCGIWLSDWDYVLMGWREWVAAPFVLLNIINRYHNFEWLPSENDFWFHGLYDVVTSHMPSFLAYSLIQLALIALLAHFARDAVVRWRRGEP